MLNLYDDIDTAIREMAFKIDAPADLLPTYRISEDGALPHIVIDKTGLYHFVVVERGQELRHDTTGSLDEILYWVFDGVTFSMACSYELHHRIKNQDFRILLFHHQEELLARLSPQWKQRKIAEHQRILVDAPFDNDLC